MKRIFTMLLAFALVMALSVTCFASSTPPSVSPVWDEENYPYGVVAYNADGSQIWFTASSIELWQMPHSSIQTAKDTGSWKTYKLSDGGTWVYQSSGTGSVTAAPNISAVMYSTHDIRQYAGDRPVVFGATPNFFCPLAEAIQGVAEETLTTQTLPALGGTMKILMVCGVGLVALLVVLKLFAKRSLIFRN